MITQRIEKHRGTTWVPQVQYPQSPLRVPGAYNGHIGPHVGKGLRDIVDESRSRSTINAEYKQTFKQSKGEFALYIEELKRKGFKKNGFVIGTVATKPYLDMQIHRLVDFDEIHHFVDDWGTPHSGPHVLYLESFQGSRFKTAPGWYQPFDEAELPEGWQAKLRLEGAPRC